MDQMLQHRFAIERVSSSTNMPKNRDVSTDSGIGTSPPKNDDTKTSLKGAKQRMPKKEAIEGEGLNKIAAGFEHDLKQLNITFLVEQNENNNRSTVDQVRVIVRYASITQVCLELDKRGQKQFWMRLLLRLKYPPEVRQVSDVFGLEDMAIRGAKKDRRREKGFRVLNWGGGDQQKLTRAISDSPILALEFEQSGPGNISALLGRLMGILKLDIEMRNIEERFQFVLIVVKFALISVTLMNKPKCKSNGLKFAYSNVPLSFKRHSFSSSVR
jgi:hypothetical protein